MVRTIPTEMLRQRLNANDVIVLDTRPAADFDKWRIPGAKNLPYSKEDGTLEDDRLQELLGDPSETEIITICAKGEGSYEFAEKLEERGYEDIGVVQDGMRGWSRLYEVAAIPTVATPLEIYQVQRVAKGCLSYVIGSNRTGEAVVVDPGRHIEEYQWIAEDDDLEIVRVIDTHVHADHISGGRALADAENATYHLPAASADRGVDVDFAPLERNEVIEIGDIEFKAIPTPGHTADSMSILVGAEALLTGDTIFVDGVGRTELQFEGDAAEEGAHELFRSIHRTILAFPDDTRVLPGHFNAEQENTLQRVSNPISTQVRTLRTERPLLRESEESFVEDVMESLPSKPPNYEQLIEINSGLSGDPEEDEATTLELGPNRCAAAAD